MLAEPLREVGRREARAFGCHVLLSVYDGSKLDDRRHTSKRDGVRPTHETDVGDELTTALGVDGDAGSPLAPMACR